MFWLNKLVGFFMTPLMLGMMVFLVSFVLRCVKRWNMRFFKGRVALALNIFGVLWIWFWGMNVTTRMLGVRLERDYPPALAKDMPKADVVLVLGGGMSADESGKMPYPEMHMAADRVWHAARLYKAGRAPVIITTGTGSGSSDRILLLDLGVPDEAIIREDKARNTEEHVALVKEALVKKFPDKQGEFKVLLVTSAWHMRRAMLNFKHSGFEVIAAPADHECMMCASASLKFVNFFPDAESLRVNSCLFKEYIGYQLYCIKYWLLRNDQSKQSLRSKLALPAIKVAAQRSRFAALTIKASRACDQMLLAQRFNAAKPRFMQAKLAERSLCDR